MHTEHQFSVYTGQFVFYAGSITSVHYPYWERKCTGGHTKMFAVSKIRNAFQSKFVQVLQIGSCYCLLRGSLNGLIVKKLFHIAMCSRFHGNTVDNSNAL